MYTIFVLIFLGNKSIKVLIGKGMVLYSSLKEGRKM